jgi:hypothetical protein
MESETVAVIKSSKNPNTRLLLQILFIAFPLLSFSFVSASSI